MDTKSLILQKALELFSKNGYEGTGVQEICEVSGITKPTLYHHFGSKKGLFDELLSENFEKFRQSVASGCRYDGDFVKTLETLFKAYFNFAVGNPVFYKMHLALIYGPSESEATKAVAKYLTDNFVLVEAMIKSATKQHGNMRGRETIIAMSLIGMINNMLTVYFMGYVNVDDHFVYRSVHQFMYGILS